MTARARGAADPTRADARVPKNEAGLVTPQTSAYAELPPMRVPEGSGGARFPHLGDSLTAFRAGRSRRATPSQPPMRCARDDPHRGPIAAFIRCTMPIVGPRWGRVGNSMGNTHYVTIPHCFTTWVRSLWKMTRPRHHPFAQQRPCRASSGGGARPPPRQTQGVSTPADAPAAARARRVGNQWRATLWPGMPPRVAGPWSRSVWTIRLARRPGAPAQRTHPSSGGVAERNLSPDSRRQPRLAAATVSVYWTRPGSQRECQQRQKRERIVYGEVAVGTEQQHPRVVARVWHARVGFV